MGGSNGSRTMPSGEAPSNGNEGFTANPGELEGRYNPLIQKMD